eukprot:575652_1
MQELNGPQNVMVGIIAGCIQCALDHPLITLKNMVQQSLPKSFNLRVLYRGTVADMIGLSSLTAIQFFGTATISNIILHNKSNDAHLNMSLTTNEMLFSCLGGGMLSGIVCSPSELIMIQQQRYGGSLLKNVSIILHTNPKLLTRGMLPSLCREGIFTMGYLGITPLLERYSYNNSVISKFGCAMISGIFATVLSNPFDTIKTCMQGDLDKRHFKGTYQSFKFLYTKYGLKRIYAGSTFRFGTVVMAFFVFNRVMEVTAPKMYPEAFEAFELKQKAKHSHA